MISDGQDVLIPGIMEHIESGGQRRLSAVYPLNLPDKMIQVVVDRSVKLAPPSAQGPVKHQYLIYGNELYVIEVNPRAPHRTLSKRVTAYPWWMWPPA